MENVSQAFLQVTSFSTSVSYLFQERFRHLPENLDALVSSEGVKCDGGGDDCPRIIQHRRFGYGRVTPRFKDVRISTVVGFVRNVNAKAAPLWISGGTRDDYVRMLVPVINDSENLPLRSNGKKRFSLLRRNKLRHKGISFSLCVSGGFKNVLCV